VARKLILMVSLVMAVAIAGGGCYTIIKHPKLNYADHDHSYYHKQCMDCHQDYYNFPYGYGYSDIPFYWGDYHNWGSYYTYPWWWESYWWDIDWHEEDNPKYKEVNQERPGRRQGLYIGYPWRQDLDPAIIVPDGGSGGSGDSDANSAGSVEDNEENSEGNTQETQKQRETKPKRRRSLEKERK